MVPHADLDFCLRLSQARGVIPYGIGRGFDRSRKNGWYIRVRGRKEYFASEALRDGEYGQRVAEAKLYGEAASAEITPAQRQLLQEMQRLADPTGYTPMEIFERGLTLVGRKPRTVMTVAEAVDQFLKVYERRRDDKLIGNKYFIVLKSAVNRIKAVFGARGLHTVTCREIEGMLLTQKICPQTRINNLRCASVLFTWAVGEGAVPANPIVITERVKRTPAIFSPSEVEKLFRVADPKIVPMLVFQWFAGLRPAATHGLTWGDVNMEAKTVSIRAEISKLREPEVIEHLPDEFWAWVSRQQKRKGRIAHPNHIKLARAAHKAMGFRLRGKRPWPTDVARHTFASHLYPRLRSIDAVAKILCHRGSRVTLKHYVAKNVTEAESAAYFKLLDAIK